MRRIGPFLASIVLFFSGSAFAETIVLKSGKEVKGKILEQTNDYVKVDYHGVPVYYEKKYVASIRSEDSGPQEPQGNSSAESGDSYLKQGLALAHEEKLEEAEQMFEKGAQVDPSDRNFEGALNILHDVKQGKITREYALGLLKGSYYLEEKEYGQAVSQLQQALDMKPGDADVCYNLAVAYQNMNNEDEALKYLGKALETNPQDAEAYSFMATIYYSKGEYQKAKENFILARELFEKRGDQEKIAEINSILEEF